MRVERLAQEHNAVPRPGLRTGRLNTELTSTLINGPPCLQ